MPEDAFTISSSSPEFFVDSFKAPFIAAPDSLYVDVGGFSGLSGVAATVTVSGNGVPFSYLEHSDDRWAFLGSLDGEALYFQEDFGGLGVYNYGEAVGVISVIPEPSMMALLLGGLSALLVLERRRN
ncbi:MAG TPA: PEP-CTERM sorting domain-containing protein [Opitutales bacterium]|nr:PEP-CTERM sorting domain-containing protein [Opitutales bacterium]